MMQTNQLLAGAAKVDITPQDLVGLKPGAERAIVHNLVDMMSKY
jgi:hypothetical protein